jgi:carboxypeptidase D
MASYFNLPSVQNSLGVNLNYTPGNNEVYYAFQAAGDPVYPNQIPALEDLLNKDVRVILYAGDADYICNWFGGEAVSLKLNYTHAKEFAQAGYAPFLINGTEYGAVREYGNFTFLRIYDCGHQVPYFQRKWSDPNISDVRRELTDHAFWGMTAMASQVMFDRALAHLDIGQGKYPITPTYSTNGTAKATHTEAFPSPSSTSA